MKHLSYAKPLLAAVVAVGAFAAASAAHARTDVLVSIGIPARPVYVQPHPVYVQPQPVYVQPRPVYYGHAPVHQHRGAWGDADHDGVPNIHDRNPRGHNGRAFQRAGWGDADRDGVPNRYDRAPRNPYRR